VRTAKQPNERGNTFPCLPDLIQKGVSGEASEDCEAAKRALPPWFNTKGGFRGASEDCEAAERALPP
jgi:hypothetical protein